MNVTLGFSPCPNDCFIFDALVHKKINTQGIDFTVIMEDVEALNNRAFDSELDITKLSYHAFIYLTNTYYLLNSGSALGFNCGPLLIQNSTNKIKDIDAASIAIPGKYTTANFLLSLAFPNAKNKKEIPFYFRWLGWIRIDSIIPISLLKKSNFLSNWFFGIESVTDKLLLKQILSD
jgi:1,4-dihydroxy-6-naphthoate synthase